MARAHPRREASPAESTTLHEITRRYVACAMQLAKVMGLPLTEQFIRDHRESISTCFIESGRAGVRLPASVQLPPLGGVDAATPVTPTSPTAPEASPLPAGEAEPPLPTHVPAGVPAAGQPIATLKPNVLAMLIAKAAQLSHADAQHWPLLAALQAERQRRLAQGQRPKLAAVEGDGHGA